MDWQTILNFALGIYAAALTTYEIVRSRRARKRTLNVQLTAGWLSHPVKQIPILAIRAVNSGERAIFVSSMRLQEIDGPAYLPIFIWLQGTLPHEFTESHSYAWVLDSRYVASTLMANKWSRKLKIKIALKDSLNDEFVSNSIEFDPVSIETEYGNWAG